MDVEKRLKTPFFLSLFSGILIIIASLYSLYNFFNPLSYAEIYLLEHFYGIIVYQPTLFPIAISFINGLIILLGTLQMKRIEKAKTAFELVAFFSFINMFIIGVGNIITQIGSVMGILGGIIGFYQTKGYRSKHAKTKHTAGDSESPPAIFPIIGMLLFISGIISIITWSYTSAIVTSLLGIAEGIYLIMRYRLKAGHGILVSLLNALVLVSALIKMFFIR